MRQVRLHVDVTNAPALGLYKRNGMRVSHVVRRYYRNGQDAYRMVGSL
jgi:ribosomal protein S18 acetylase RimI-like enzyme